MKQKPTDKYPKLQTRYEVIEKQKRAHFELVRKSLTADGSNIYLKDLLIVAVLKRSLDLLDGIICLTNRWNFVAAAPLLRLQLDNLLKLSYIARCKKADELIKAVLEGESFQKLKDSEGKLLFDSRLRDYARPLYPWLDRVYEETSKLIHLSDKHCFLPIISVDNKARTTTTFVGVGIPNWPGSEIDNFLNAVSCATDALLKVVLGWVISKGHTQKDDNIPETDKLDT